MGSKRRGKRHEVAADAARFTPSGSRQPYSGPTRRAVAFVCGAEILSLTGFSLVPALLPQFIASWSLSNAEAGWLAGMMSAGYMVAVLPLVALTDRMPARTIFLVSSALNALSCFGIAFSDGLLPALIWRAVSGIAVAGMYMPGLRALTDGMAGATRARAAAWYTSSFTLGSSLSFLLGQAGLVWNWHGAFVVSGALGVIGVLLAWTALPRMNTEPPAERPRGVPNFHRVLGNRDVLVLTLGYTATIWGTAGLRQWIVVFLTFCAAKQGGGATEGWIMLVTGSLVGLLGVPAGLYGNELSLRLGLRTTAMGVFLASALVNALFGFAAMLSYGEVVVLALAAGFVVQGNFSNLTSGLLAVAEPWQRGTTVAVYSCIGFAGGFVGTLLFGLSLDWFGGTERLVAWVVAFGICAVACLIGAIATAFLSSDLGSRDSEKLSG
jgi:predicted MFS family arabinose efflux permease